ncbi:uncharacterized protein LOC123265965 [Cotesia glomerata]|uniref:Uncharacterized protein n=1 Tax=Cotesia glomerata TaxID=32391 RepID=A0AAV7IXB9_COTGL|nr:uncharacterized protein LOC123265965 [Cotesia glomerata]KAH0560419.1 hypothetical protein KQX54_004412 [Cotesia glomerata]
MARKSFVRIISMIVFIGMIFCSTDGAPPITAAFIDSNNDLLSQISNGRSEPEKLIRKPRSSGLEELEDEAEDDLETAAGTNLMRPLFVYRQQMESRARQNRKAIDRRHALFY